MRTAPTRDDMIALTPLWTGERFDDGRPRVPDEVLEELRQATTEEAWGTMLHAGYPRQFASPWLQTHPGTITVGRAITAQFVPHRPDLDAVVVEAGAAEGHEEGDRQNSWVIEALEENDIMVVDIFGKVIEGTVIGDNLGTAVASRTKVGAVINGGVRDLQGLVELVGGVNFFYRGADPTPIRNVTLAGINLVIRIDEATVLPGDVVLGTMTGVSFIPAHLAGEVATQSAETRTRDVFGKRRLSERIYTSAQIDVGVWADDIQSDYDAWKAERAAAAEATAAVAAQQAEA